MHICVYVGVLSYDMYMYIYIYIYDKAVWCNFSISVQ